MRYFLFVLVIILSSISLFASEIDKRLKLNKDHSFIKFSIPYLKISEVEGQFRDFDGEIKRDQAGEILNYQIKIKTSSIDTNNKLRDKHLNEAEFFNSRKNPFIYLNYSPQDNEFVLKLGNRVIRQKQKLPALISQVDTWGKKSYFQSISTKVDLKDFGFKWNKSLPGGELLLGDNLDIKAVFQWQNPSQMTASSKHRIPETKALKKIRLEGNSYKELKPEMVNRKKRSLTKISQTANASVYVRSPKNSLWGQIVILLGIFGIVGFYLMTRLYFSNSKFPGLIIDLIFISYLAIYLFLGWKF